MQKYLKLQNLRVILQFLKRDAPFLNSGSDAMLRPALSSSGQEARLKVTKMYHHFLGLIYSQFWSNHDKKCFISFLNIHCTLVNLGCVTRGRLCSTHQDRLIFTYHVDVEWVEDCQITKSFYSCTTPGRENFVQGGKEYSIPANPRKKIKRIQEKFFPFQVNQ